VSHVLFPLFLPDGLSRLPLDAIRLVPAGKKRRN
jgi:hypothetical protein